MAEGQLLDRGHRGFGGCPPGSHPGAIPVRGKRGFPYFFVCVGLLPSGLVFAPDLVRPEAGGAKGGSSADPLPGFDVGDGGGNLCPRLYGTVLYCQACIVDISVGSIPPVHIQLLSSQAYLSQMVVPACITEPARWIGSEVDPLPRSMLV